MLKEPHRYWHSPSMQDSALDGGWAHRGREVIPVISLSVIPAFAQMTMEDVPAVPTRSFAQKKRSRW
ncbi:hypothetical protein [Sphingopyxis alaskensis]|jgi:hypothetical protein|uniref:hypothetical protein n=1 Tax=Sphingopyxis alaskensis TaxID=117207 RepID=UPI00203C7AD5|nr:hypothetical protein [Sphingopyxis alaskensis]